MTDPKRKAVGADFGALAEERVEKRESVRADPHLRRRFRAVAGDGLEVHM